jgi:sugar phosphate isomerase/epimerase
MKKGDYIINDLYNPSYNNGFDMKNVPSYISGMPPIPSGQMGMTTDPRTANQLSELSNKLNQGTIPIEIGTMGMNEWDTIPTEHFNEMRRKADLSGAKVSVHAPIQGMDPAGFGEKGWEESQQELVKRQLIDVVDKSAKLTSKKNPEPVPITIHGSNYHGSTWKYVEDEKGKREKVYDTLMAVDVETGQAVPIREDIKYYPSPVFGKESKKIEGYVQKKDYSPEKQLEIQNATKWDDTMQKIEFQRESAVGALKDLDITVQAGIFKGEITPENPGYGNAVQRIQFAEEHLQEVERSLSSEFSRAYKIAKSQNDTNQIERLNEISKKYAERLGVNKKDEVGIESRLPSIKSQVMGETIRELRSVAPKQFVPVEDFAKEKASDTFAEVALHSYKEHQENAPIISIENLDQGRFGFSQGEDLAELVEKSREKFVKAAIAGGMKEKEADAAAKKVIGVTFDVGHLNISKKFGFKDEDLKKEAEKVAEYVKHVHLTDNFGYSDTHLPIGMGNVPVKELMEALGEKGKEARKINEVGGWFQFFKDSPFPHLLQAAGSPLYSAQSGPYWTQTSGFQQSYSSGAGMMLPGTHYSMFGAGFSQLPVELGGSTKQEGGRFGGGA